MTKIFTTAGAAVLTLALAYGAAHAFAPGWAAEMRGWLQLGQDWSEEAMQRDPVGYLEHTRQRLQMEQSELAEHIRALRTSAGPLEGHIQGRTGELARTEAFLKEGRSVYRQAQAQPPAGGIRFAGRVYPDLATFKAQLELLFNEKTNNERLLAQANATRERLDQQLYTMLLQKGKLEMAIQEIGPQIAIVRAEHSAREVQTIINAGRRLSEGVLNETAQLMADFPLGTTRDLMESAQQRSPDAATSQAFEAFLDAPA